MRRWAVAYHFLSVALLTIGCSSPAPPTPFDTPAARDRWPLAVQNGGGGDRARTEGFLGREGGCVYLTHPNGDRAFLVWQSDQVRWDAENGMILFAAGDGQVRPLGFGQKVGFGGGGASIAEDGNVAGILAGIDWLVPPQPECDTSEVFFVNEWSEPRR
jgi:hypothetical protein